MEDNWISVEDRLPEDKTKVRVKRKADGREKNATFYLAKHFLSGKPLFAYRSSNDKNYIRRKKRAEERYYPKEMIDAMAATGYYSIKEITHWQPLPEPPKN